MIEGKGLGGKKVNRVNISMDNKYNKKLLRLATACNMRPTSLAGLLVELSLDNPELVTKLQAEYGIHTAYKVVPVKNYTSGEIEYALNERSW
ncbi:hypothetical protein [Cytobacillus firmus]|uniref:hypothetical protein n=1 Tax=Cytobacillus firmus TaxID=1399 RepID=UPI0018CD28B2|nr:hypothetical protein [Cytobacillus firmus]MBG9657801.1 hypothetical protein [Cytobacillus firmus]MED1904799.1 hypothetical protein [Cytobacillus firmus]